MSAETSSIGPQWPPEKSSFGRIKGIDNRKPISTKESLLEDIGTVDELIATINSYPDGVSRLSIRLVIDDGLLRQNYELIKSLGEVIIPLSGTQSDLDEADIIYLAYNSPERISNPKDLAYARGNLAIALTRIPLSCTAILDRAKRTGYDLRVLSMEERAHSETVKNQMSDLYTRFGWEPSQVWELLKNNSNIIAVALCGELIVSAGVAETSKINFKTEHSLVITELTEAATQAEHQGKGLYTAVAAMLMRELADHGSNGNKIGLVFGECNGLAGGVLNASKSLGRTISVETTESWKAPFLGYLQQHVPIETPSYKRLTKFNDLFPAFISRDGLNRFVNS